MKKTTKLTTLLIVSMAAITQKTNAQFAPWTVERCVEATMNNRNTGERVAAKIIPGLEKVQRGAAENNCRMEEVQRAIERPRPERVERPQRDPAGRPDREPVERPRPEPVERPQRDPAIFDRG
jgi:hypothetical protein